MKTDTINIQNTNLGISSDKVKQEHDITTLRKWGAELDVIINYNKIQLHTRQNDGLKNFIAYQEILLGQTNNQIQIVKDVMQNELKEWKTKVLELAPKVYHVIASQLT